MSGIIIPSTSITHGSKRFKIALSFPGEQRSLVGKIAEKLADKLTVPCVLYDRFHRSEFARPNLDTYLQDLYRNQSDLIIVFLCSKYDEKKWCGIEWRAIRDLMNQKIWDNRIMFVRCDKGDVSGIFGTIDGYLSTDEMTIDEITNDIIQRYGTI